MLLKLSNQTKDNIKLILLFSLVFAFIAWVFYFSLTAHASYIIDTGCTYSDTGTQLDGFSRLGNTVRISDPVTNETNYTLYVYSVDSACGLDTAIFGATYNLPQYEQLGIEFINETTIKVMNFTTNTQIGTNITISQGVKGISVNVYQTSSPMIENHKSDSYLYTDQQEPLKYQSNFRDGMVTRDFALWNMQLYLNDLPKDKGYYFIVEYGVDIDDYTDNSFTQTGSYYLNGTTLVEIDKTTDLDIAYPQQYLTRAKLYNEDDELQYTTPTYIINIVAGEKISIANNTAQFADETDFKPQCQSTAFAIPEFNIALGYKFPKLDFGQGFCTMFTTLFYPSSANFELRKQEIIDTMSVQFPLNIATIYLENLTENLDPTTDYELITGDTITIGSNSFDIPPLTIDAQLQPIFNTIRPVINALLYLSFFSTLLFFGLSIFRRTGQ